MGTRCFGPLQKQRATFGSSETSVNPINPVIYYLRFPSGTSVAGVYVCVWVGEGASVWMGQCVCVGVCVCVCVTQYGELSLSLSLSVNVCYLKLYGQLMSIQLLVFCLILFFNKTKKKIGEINVVAVFT